MNCGKHRALSLPDKQYVVSQTPRFAGAFVVFRRELKSSKCRVERNVPDPRAGDYRDNDRNGYPNDRNCTSSRDRPKSENDHSAQEGNNPERLKLQR